MRKIRKEKSSGTWGFDCISKGEDNDNIILVWLGSVVYTIYFDWFFLNPYQYTWKHGGNEHKMIASKQIGFTVHVGEGWGYITANYGANKDFLMSAEDGSNIKHISTWHKTWGIPWIERTFREYALLNLDGTVFHIVKPNGPFPWNFPGHERIQFVFYDGFDNEKITATVYRERRTWTKGTSWMSWLKYVTKPIIHDSLSFSFSQEVGSKKGSWKGGTTGHGIDVEDGETVMDACIRYCKNQGHRFEGFVTRADGEYIYKNIVNPKSELGIDANKAEGQGKIL